MYSVQQIVEMYENRKDEYDFGVRTHNAKEAQNIINILDYYGLILTEGCASPINFGDDVCNDIIITWNDGTNDNWDVAYDYKVANVINYNDIDFTTLPKGIEFEI